MPLNHCGVINADVAPLSVTSKMAMHSSDNNNPSSLPVLRRDITVTTSVSVIPPHHVTPLSHAPPARYRPCSRPLTAADLAGIPPGAIIFRRQQLQTGSVSAAWVASFPGVARSVRLTWEVEMDWEG